MEGGREASDASEGVAGEGAQHIEEWSRKFWVRAEDVAEVRKMKGCWGGEVKGSGGFGGEVRR